MGSSTLEAATVFARLVVKRGLATPEHVVECLQDLYALAAQGVKPLPRLGELLAKKGYLAPDQTEATVHAASDSRPNLKPPVEEPQGERVGKYIKTEKLGEGGMGQVWKAWDTQLCRWVALKFLKHGSEEDLAYFRREAQTAGKLSHPNIAAVYEAHPSYIAMQYIDGVTLSKHSKDDLKLVVEIVRQAAVAVQFAHEQGVVHRDLKPANIMVVRTDRKSPTTRRLVAATARTQMPVQVYVMDFGLAKPMNVDSSLSVAGKVLGTPKYMSPEQARGSSELDHRADVYSLGATLYECVTDQPVFDDPNIYKLLRKIVEDEPKRVRKIKSSVDPDLETIILKCLEKEPARRYASAVELAEDLKRWLDGEAILAHPASITYRTRKWVKKNTWSWGLAAAALVAIAGLVTVGAIVTEAGKEKRAIDAIHKAERMYDAGKYVEVRTLIDEALLLEPNLAEAKYWLARLSIRDYQRMRGVPEARVVRGLVELVPPRPETTEEKNLRTEAEKALRGVPNVMMAQGILALWSNQLTEAFRCFLLVRPDEPGAWEAEFYLGITHYLRGDFESARKALMRHRTRDAQLTLPVWIRIHLALGQQAERTGGEYEKLYIEARAASYGLEKAGSLVEAQVLIAWGRAEESRGRGTLDKFEKAIDLIRDWSDVEAQAARGDAWLAIAEFRRVRGKLDPADPVEYKNAIQAYETADYGPGRLRKAEAHWARYKFLESVGHIELADLKQAQVDFENALGHNPRYADASLGLAEVTRELREKERADLDTMRIYDEHVQTLQNILSQHPQYAPAHRARGILHRLRGDWRSQSGIDPSPDYEASLKDLAQALKLAPADSESLRCRGDTLAMRAAFRSSKGLDANPDYASAVESYEAALKLNPQDSATFRQISRAHIDWAGHRGRFGEEATDHYQAAVERAAQGIEANSQDAEAFHARGVAYHEWGRHELSQGREPFVPLDKALADFNTALKCNRQFYRALFCRGLTLQAIGQYRMYHGGDAASDYEKAIAEFELSIGVNPRHSEAYHMRGETRRLVGVVRQSAGQDPSSQYQAALKDLDRALELNPRNGVALLIRCDTRLRLAMQNIREGKDPAPDYHAAKTDATRALEINPKNAEALCKRGAALQGMAKYRENRGENADEEYLSAIRDLLAASQINSKDAEPFRRLGLALQNLAFSRSRNGIDPVEDYQSALKHYTRAIEINSKDAETFRYRGITNFNMATYSRAKRQNPAASYRSAWEDLSRSIELNPKEFEAFFMRGLARRNWGVFNQENGEDPKDDYEQALGDFTRALELFPTLPEAFFERAVTHFFMSHVEEARKDFEKAVQLKPQLKPAADAWLNRLK